MLVPLSVNLWIFGIFTHYLLLFAGSFPAAETQSVVAGFIFVFHLRCHLLCSLPLSGVGQCQQHGVPDRTWDPGALKGLMSPHDAGPKPGIAGIRPLGILPAEQRSLPLTNDFHSSASMPQVQWENPVNLRVINMLRALWIYIVYVWLINFDLNSFIAGQVGMFPILVGYNHLLYQRLIYCNHCVTILWI